MIHGSNYQGLTDLIDQNITCYEFFYSQPKEIQERIRELDINNFEEMQHLVSNMREEKTSEKNYIRRRFDNEQEE